LLFGTPTGLDFRPAVEMYGGRFVRPDAWPAFRDAVRQGLARPGLTVVEVRTDRAQNVSAHRAIWPAVAAAVRDLLPTGAAEAVTARDLAGVAR
ncbi:MAG TPA: hypothetical protein VM536_21205, partial [Chloroflexia bacterium]|nr:hypothetical protein [Chloroflexia bacterium]